MGDTESEWDYVNDVIAREGHMEMVRRLTPTDSSPSLAAIIPGRPTVMSQHSPASMSPEKPLMVQTLGLTYHRQ